MLKNELFKEWKRKDSGNVKIILYNEIKHQQYAITSILLQSVSFSRTFFRYQWFIKKHHYFCLETCCCFFKLGLTNLFCAYMYFYTLTGPNLLRLCWICSWNWESLDQPTLFQSVMSISSEPVQIVAFYILFLFGTRLRQCVVLSETVFFHLFVFSSSYLSYR